MAKKKKLTYTSLRDNKDIHSGYEQAPGKRCEESLGSITRCISAAGASQLSRILRHAPPSIPISSSARFKKAVRPRPRSAVAEATESFPAVESTDWEERVRIIRASRKSSRSRASPLPLSMTYEVGKNRFEALAEVYEAVEMAQVQLRHL